MWWAPILVALLTALRDFLRHAGPTLPTYE